ncbi:MAG: hypothetical protein ACI8QT_001925 [Halioglobus sp.]|jgi:hypothetical protein
MPLSQRADNMDVSNTVDVTDSRAVTAALRSILDRRYPGFDFAPVNTMVEDFICLYQGEYPGYQACDVSYHNIQHVLDVTLAMARLIDGYESATDEHESLGPELALTGIACAVFHDSGYIRRSGDRKHKNGAEYTRIHVSRSARFMGEYLPTIGHAYLVPRCMRIVHFTGYEVDPCNIEVDSAKEYSLGSLLGTADLIAQMADKAYLQKCHDFLYTEFVAGGIAGDNGLEGYAAPVYQSAEHLLALTPNYMRTAIDVRLDGYFNRAYRYAAEFFGGPNLYMEAIELNRLQLERLLASK